MNAGPATEAVRARIGSRRPEFAVVLGSGLGEFTERISDAVRIPYAEVPGFPLPTVEGHRGELVCGSMSGRGVLVQSGRFHLYEGYAAATAALPIRLFAGLGVHSLIITNAAGGIRRTFARGALMLIADQVNLSFRNPLIGPLVEGDERFPDMSAPYDAELRSLARTVARERRIPLEEGVYAGVLGPSYETAAEIRMLERLGADAVGMSTVAEVVAARARGLRCLGISTVTNMATGLSGVRLSHEEVVAVAGRVRSAVGELIEGVVERGRGR